MVSKTPRGPQGRSLTTLTPNASLGAAADSSIATEAEAEASTLDLSANHTRERSNCNHERPVRLTSLTSSTDARPDCTTTDTSSRPETAFASNTSADAC